MIHIIALTFFIIFGELHSKCFVFNDNYAEVWYSIPVHEVFSLPSMQDSLFKYQYRIVINSENGDSVIREGIKGIKRGCSEIGDFVLDFYPIFLYPGRFGYKLTILLCGEKFSSSGEIEIIGDTALFYASDLILGSRNKRDSLFVRRGIKFTPKIIPTYSNQDTLFSYIEIYGLVPDSLLYFIRYQIKDSLEQIVYDNRFKRFKYAYTQFDTVSIYLGNYQGGIHQLIVEVFEPNLNLGVKKECVFFIKEFLPEIDDKPYAWEIKYLISDREYKRFLGMNHNEQVRYLKRFWSKHNYKEFEKRLLEADVRFSTSFIKGRDTPMGRYYINNGPPDEIYVYGPGIATEMDIQYKGAHIDEPEEVWIYETKGIQVIFRDKNKDGIFELVGFAEIGDKEKEDYWQEREELWRYMR
ncbi:MAG: GWxTD domain-containing protein [candidate division WOR-3 bacterium]